MPGFSDFAQALAALEAAKPGEGYPWVWDEFVHRSLIDPELEAVRERCARLDTTSEEGRELLRHELYRLRAEDPP